MMTRLVLPATARIVLAMSLLGFSPGMAAAEAFTLLPSPGDPALEMQLRRDLQGDDLQGKDGPFAKVGHDLTQLFREHEAFRRTGAGAFRPSDANLPVRDGFVVIDAASEDPQALRADLEALGLQNGATYRRVVSGRLPISAIGEAAALTSLRFARAATFQTNIGVTTSQGDSAMETGMFRSMNSVDGTGITIGTLSDSYDCFTTAAAAEVSSGDLPGVGNPLGHTTPVEVLDDDACGADEGRAMMQLMHDVAPGAALSFHTATLGQASFALGIEELAGCPPGATAGCVPAATPADILVDDVSYFAAPFFQDGIVAQAVDFVTSAGVAYFSSSGNFARNSYESPFVDSGSTIDIGAGPQRAHDFDPGPGVDVFQQVTIPKFTIATVAFQWDQPFFSVSGGSGSLSDFDILLLDDPPTTVLKSSLNTNVGGDPVEVFQYAHALSTTTFNIAIIEHDPGLSEPDPGLMKYVAFQGMTVDEYATQSSTTFGHANAAGAEAVGAAFYGDTPPFGTTPPVVEDFSSAGGTPILFSTSGVPLGTPVVREKPEIVAPDGANTTFFGNDIPEDADTFPNFFGTSAAAPHAAALGALLLQVTPTWSPQDLYTHLESTAIDMDDPLTGGFDTGFDFATGYGLVRAVTPTVSTPPGTLPGRVSAWSYPNPFGPSTTIRFTLAEGAFVRVSIFDVNGRRVRTVAEGSFDAGAHEAIWDARDVEGETVPNGIYFVRVEAGDFVQTHRAVLMR
jgi:Subtilase family/FlgD Ig-like domain